MNRRRLAGRCATTGLGTFDRGSPVVRNQMIAAQLQFIAHVLAVDLVAHVHLVGRRALHIGRVCAAVVRRVQRVRVRRVALYGAGRVFSNGRRRGHFIRL